jgi:hypothetical protein
MLTGVVLGRGQGGRDRLHAGRGEVPVYVLVCGFARKTRVRPGTRPGTGPIIKRLDKEIR